MRKDNHGHIGKIVLVLIALVFSACFLLSLRIQDNQITIEGNQKYTKEELIQYLFPSDGERNPLVILWNTRFGEKKEIPFVDMYEIHVNSLHSISVSIYEKKIVGYVKYKGVNMYFDKDGTIVESSSRQLDGIPEITGLQFDYIVLDARLPVEDQKVFRMILDVTLALTKHEVPAERLYISEKKETTVYVGQVAVELGTNQDTNEKIQALSDMLPELVDLQGVLDMKEFNEDRNSYTFKKNS